MSQTDTTPTVTATAAPTMVITGNAAVDGILFKGIVALATFLAAWAAAHINLGNIDPAWITAGLIGFFIAIATTAWGYVRSKLHTAQAVQAGINLAVSGNAIMQGTWNGKATPLPVTPASAQQIVKDFGNVKVAVSDEPARTASLNRAQLPGK